MVILSRKTDREFSLRVQEFLDARLIDSPLFWKLAAFTDQLSLIIFDHSLSLWGLWMPWDMEQFLRPSNVKGLNTLQHNADHGSSHSASSCILFESSYLECQDCNTAPAPRDGITCAWILSGQHIARDSSWYKTAVGAQEAATPECCSLWTSNLDANWPTAQKIPSQFSPELHEAAQNSGLFDNVWYVFWFLVLTPLATKRCLQIRRLWQKRKHWDENWMLDMIWLQTENLLGLEETSHGEVICLQHASYIFITISCFCDCVYEKGKHCRFC